MHLQLLMFTTFVFKTGFELAKCALMIIEIQLYQL